MGFIEFYHGYPDKEVLYIATLLLCEDYCNHRYGQEVKVITRDMKKEFS
jgi:hypothetical protein